MVDSFDDEKRCPVASPEKSISLDSKRVCVIGSDDRSLLHDRGLDAEGLNRSTDGSLSLGVWSSLPLHETESRPVAIVNINCYKVLKLLQRGNFALSTAAVS